MLRHTMFLFFFFFNDTATTEIYTLSLHDALPISAGSSEEDAPIKYVCGIDVGSQSCSGCVCRPEQDWLPTSIRSEEHTSELQSHLNLVCRLLLEKKKQTPLTDSTSCPTLPIYTHI